MLHNVNKTRWYINAWCNDQSHCACVCYLIKMELLSHRGHTMSEVEGKCEELSGGKRRRGELINHGGENHRYHCVRALLCQLWSCVLTGCCKRATIIISCVSIEWRVSVAHWCCCEINWTRISPEITWDRLRSPEIVQDRARLWLTRARWQPRESSSLCDQRMWMSSNKQMMMTFWKVFSVVLFVHLCVCVCVCVSVCKQSWLL